MTDVRNVIVIVIASATTETMVTAAAAAAAATEIGTGTIETEIIDLSLRQDAMLIKAETTTKFQCDFLGVSFFNTTTKYEE